MVDLTPLETAAIEAALQPVATMLDTIGWQTPPCAWSRAQMLGFIRAGVEGFQDAMRAATLQPAPITSADCPF